MSATSGNSILGSVVEKSLRESVGNFVKSFHKLSVMMKDSPRYFSGTSQEPLTETRIFFTDI